MSGSEELAWSPEDQSVYVVYLGTQVFEVLSLLFKRLQAYKTDLRLITFPYLVAKRVETTWPQHRRSHNPFIPDFKNSRSISILFPTLPVRNCSTSHSAHTKWS